MQREIRKGGKLGFDDDRVPVGNWAGRPLPQGPPSFQEERLAAATIGMVDKERMASESPTGVAVVREVEGALADVLLIVEDLLLQARTLSESDAPTEAIGAILDHVAALREGRG